MGGSSGTVKAVSLALLVGSWMSFEATFTMIFCGVGAAVVVDVVVVVNVDRSGKFCVSG